MKNSQSLYSAGIIMLFLGTIFHLQGNSFVGPESSFMYSNPQWITYGLLIIISGTMTVILGLYFRIIKHM